MSSCFDVALEYLQGLQRKMPCGFSYDTESLIFDVELLKTFVLYARQIQAKCNSSNSEKGEILGKIEVFVSRMAKDIQTAYLSSGGDGALIEIKRCRKDIKFFGTDINQVFISLLDDHYYSIGGHHQPLVDLFLSLSERLMDIWISDLQIKGILHNQKEDLREKLRCSRGFIEDLIDFATRQGVDQVELADLLIHVEVLAVDAACLIYTLVFDRDKNDKNKLVQTCQLLQKMKPFDADLQLRKAYIHVLEGSRSQRPSTKIFSPEKDDGLMVAAKFMDSLLGDLAELQQSYTSLFFSIHDGMQKLHQGVSFLCILVGEQHGKFTALDDELKDRIGVVVIDAGILIWSISLNELKEGLTEEIDVTLSHLLQELKLIMAEVEHIHSPPTSSAFGFPTTNELGSVDFLLENLNELASCDSDANSIALLKDQISTVQEGLQSLRFFLETIAGQRSQNIKLQTLWNRVMEVAHKAEFVIDSIMVAEKPGCSPISLDTITKEIKFLEAEALDVCGSMSPDNAKALRRVTETLSFYKPSQISPPALNENLVGLEEEVTTIFKKLLRGPNHLDVVSIVGMPGIGKTTLANAVYNNASVMHHFHIRAWCTVSQAYSKRDLLLQLLGDTVSMDTDEADLAKKLYMRLKGKRYLIILDDVWDIEGLNLLRKSIPDNANRSRILFISQRHDLCSLFKVDIKPLHLRLLTDAESWKLLQNKIFGNECCPPILSAIGMQIAKACQGLPLAVVGIAGVLANIDQNRWEEVANSLSSSSSTLIGIEHCMKTLERSYTCLPDYLKPCLLYFGAFSKDQEIPVRRLLWLWISEGFVQISKVKSLEEVANEYLMDLINRSLVMVIGQRSIGSVKICRVHNLLHEFCVAKAKEKRFLQIVHAYGQIFTLNTPYNSHRLCIYSKIGDKVMNRRVFFPHLRSLLLVIDSHILIPQNCSFIFRMFKLLRVLDIGSIYWKNENFLGEVELLVHLRYLAIARVSMPIPSGIANLSRLETFVIARNRTSVVLPDTIWNMKKLRYLHCPAGFIFPTNNLEVSPDLYHLETCTLCIDSSSESLQKIIKKFPSIRRLKFQTSRLRFFRDRRYSRNRNLQTPIVLDYFDRLESLRMRELSPTEICFPLNIKKLTLSSYKKPWSEISTIIKLPNLGVLKLLKNSFLGPIWEMKEEQFPRLKFLKLEELDLCRWTASCENFPCLEKLVLYGCRELENVPSSLGDIPTLMMIEVRSCCKYATNSAKQIQEEQMDVGNENLKIVIHFEEATKIFS